MFYSVMIDFNFVSLHANEHNLYCINFLTCLCTTFEPRLVGLCAKLQPVLACELDLVFAVLLHSTALYDTALRSVLNWVFFG